MNSEAYSTLGKLVDDAMHNTYAGLYTMLHSDKSFPKKIERNYRLKSFSENHDFYLTASERQIHLMGFIDAIIWFQRSGWFCQPKEDGEIDDADDYDGEPETEDDRQAWALAQKQKEAIYNAIICFETGEEW